MSADFETTANGWKVLDKERGILSYEYTFAKDGSTANAFAARAKDGKMVVVSPPCRIDEGVFTDLLEFGEVGAVVANNGFHHLGQPVWRERFPNARFFADGPTKARIQKKNEDAPEFEPMSALAELLGDDVGVTAAPSDATKCGETWAWAKGAGGNVWFASDILSNMPSLPKKFIVRMLFKMTGTKAGYGLFNTAMKFILKDKKRVLAAMAKDLEAHPPTIVIPGHGPIVTDDGLAETTQAIVAAAL